MDSNRVQQEHGSETLTLLQLGSMGVVLAANGSTRSDKDRGWCLPWTGQRDLTRTWDIMP
jgi:hypothetical protein